jgi:Raf kinase inhibitor-like YbhB/YbcL family protein
MTIWQIRTTAALALACWISSGCNTRESTAEPADPIAGKGGVMKVTSQAFDHHGAIPTKYTCEGSDVSPPLAWSGIPGNAKSLALIVDDPDAPDPKAPKRTWVHWVLYDLAPSVTGLPEHTTSPPAGGRDGTNDWNRAGYGGPCPPIGRHRYFFKLYALDAELGDLKKPNKAQLEAAMRGHIVAQSELIGTYEKQKK